MKPCMLELDQYDKILVQFSGGKDSLMMLLRLLSLGVDKKKIQLWHQCIDGKGDGFTEHFMDWPSTEGYVKSIADYFQIPLIWSWRACIFFSPDHWATLNEIDPKVTQKLHEIEEELGFTIDNKLTLNEMIQLGKSTLSPENSYWVKYALSPWQGAVNASAWTHKWMLPAGAFGSGGGAI